MYISCSSFMNHLFIHSFGEMWSYTALFSALLMQMMAPVFFRVKKTESSGCSCCLLGSFQFAQKCCQRGSNFGWLELQKIHILFDLKSPNFVFFHAISVSRDKNAFCILVIFNAAEMFLSRGEIQTMQTERLYSG